MKTSNDGKNNNWFSFDTSTWNTPTFSFGGGGTGKNDFGFSISNIKPESFRDSIKYNRIPSCILSLDLFGDYYFDHLIQDKDKNQKQDVNNEERLLFSPTYCCAKAIIPDALLPHIMENNQKNNNQEEKKQDGNVNTFEYYMTVNLNSNLSENDYNRNPLNLVICLDISGSMNATFDDKWDPEWKYKNEHKIEIAKKCLNAVLNHLKENDSFGLILFNDEAMIFQKLETVSKLDIDDLKSRISLYIEAAGGTNMDVAYKSAVTMLIEQDTLSNNTENRIIFLTDDKISNNQEMDESNLLGMMNKFSDKDKGKIYSTIIAVGLDFEHDLIEKITNIKGANYYSVHCEKELIQTMDHDFDLMINPLLFDLKLTVEVQKKNCCIDKVYGVDQDTANNILKNGQIIKINTLFPSKGGCTFIGCSNKGIILLKFKMETTINVDDNESDDDDVKICVSYQDKNGIDHKTEKNISFEKINKMDYFENESIRKGVLLCRYFDLLDKWIEHDKHYFDIENSLNILKVSPVFLDKFLKFLPYFQGQMEQIKDDKLQNEIKLLEKLIGVEEMPTFTFFSNNDKPWNFTTDTQQNDTQQNDVQ